MAASGEDLTIGYGNAKLQAKGFTSIIASLLIFLGAVAYYTHTQTQIERRNEHVSVMDELRIITYILSQPEDKRPALAMPKGLQERLQKSYYFKD